LVPPILSHCPRCGREHEREVEPAIEEELIEEDLAPGKVRIERPPYFPYRPRPSQVEIVRAVEGAMDGGKHLVMESGTGTGKTVCSLVGALQHAKANKKKVLYLTRTISQSDQVMKELRSISRRQKVTGIPMLGRQVLPPHTKPG